MKYIFFAFIKIWISAIAIWNSSTPPGADHECFSKECFYLLNSHPFYVSNKNIYQSI